jgi:hypothetical protein
MGLLTVQGARLFAPSGSVHTFEQNWCLFKNSAPFRTKKTLVWQFFAKFAEWRKDWRYFLRKKTVNRNGDSFGRHSKSNFSPYCWYP